MRNSILLVLFSVLAVSCQNETVYLPPIGMHDYDTKVVDGVEVTDTVFYAIPEFSFTNQRGETVDKEAIKGKVYVADFFFSHCSTSCPQIKKNELEHIWSRFSSNPNFAILSHSFDPERDDVERLSTYAGKLGIEGENWHLMTGDQDEMLDLALKYLNTAEEDVNAPDGFEHSNNIMLIDPEGRIRSFCEGTDAESVIKFNEDIQNILTEYGY